MSLYKYKNIYIYNIKMLNIKYIIFLIFIGVVYYIYTFIKKIHTKIINLDDIYLHLVKHLPNKYLYANIYPVDQYRTVNFWKEYISNI